VTGEMAISGRFIDYKQVYDVEVSVAGEGYGTVTLDDEAIDVLEGVEDNTVVKISGNRITLGSITIVAVHATARLDSTSTPSQVEPFQSSSERIAL